MVISYAYFYFSKYGKWAKIFYAPETKALVSEHLARKPRRTG
jgi:hypothetical protein